MYNVTSTGKTSFISNIRQTAKITFYGTGTTTTFTESNIIQSSLSVDRYCVTGDKIEIGSAVSSELTFKLNNRDGQFDDLAIEGAELYARIYVGSEYVPLGYFVVNGSPRHLRTIEITADDRMVKFDQPVDASLFSDNTTVASYIRTCCNACGITLATNVDNLTNASYNIPTFPTDDEVTYRTVLQWCAAITGTCAYIDWNGRLRLEWYSDNITGETISPSERYDSDMYENDIVISGVSATVANDDGDDVTYTTDEDNTYVIDISDCQLLQSGGDVQGAITALGNKLTGFAYRPYSCETKPMPWLYPLDMIDFVDKNGVTHRTIITNATFTMNAHSKFEGKGETATSNSYYQQSLTSKISQILSTTKKNTVRLTSAEQTLVEFNEILENASGLYSTTVKENGATTYYFHDKSTLAESSVIYKFNSGGFAWTTSGWNGGSPVWTYGFDTSGDGILNNVLVNYLQANKLTADEINVSNIVGAINDSDESELCINADRITLESGSDLESQLSLYVTSEGLTTTLSSYTTTSQLKSQLSSYVTSSSLTTKLTSYAPKTGGTASSFAYSLTSSDFTLTANDKTVMKVTADGLSVKGIIEAESGSIAGFTIESNSLYAQSGGTEEQPEDGVYISPSITQYYHWITNTIKTGNESMNASQDLSHGGSIEFSQARCILYNTWVVETRLQETTGATTMNRPYYHNKYYPLFEIRDTGGYFIPTSSGVFTVVIFFGYDTYEQYSTGEPTFEIRMIEGSIEDLRTNAGSGNIVPL